MIVTAQKPLDEVLDSISPYSNILIAGCDGCTQPPRGLREAKTLSQLLELGGRLRGKDFQFKVTTLVKQCDSFLTASALKPQMDGIEAVLSLACGVGVQTLADLFPDLPVLPAQNTHFMGMEDREGGILEERCTACGNCLLAETGGICPVTRCAKGLLNGACGGARNGKCEMNPAKDCAWELIYQRLAKQDKLDLIREFRPPRNYQLKAWRLAP
jgi:hypothetical protein